MLKAKKKTKSYDNDRSPSTSIQMTQFFLSFSVEFLSFASNVFASMMNVRHDEKYVHNVNATQYTQSKHFAFVHACLRHNKNI